MDDGTVTFPAADASGLAGLTQRQQLLRQQLAQALTMQNRAPMKGYGTLGGIGAGLANAAHGIFGQVAENRAEDALKENASEQAASRAAILNAILGGDGQSQAQADAPPPPARMGTMAQPEMSPGAHPLPIGQPVQEPGLAQLAALGIKPPAGAGPSPAAAPVSGGPPMQQGGQPMPEPMSGLDQLAALSARHQKAGLALMGSGDPTLTRAGEALLERAQREQAMGFEGGQKSQDRDVARERIANERYQVVPNAFGGGFVRIDKQTGETTMLGGGQGAGGGMASPGTRLGDAQTRLVQDYTDRMSPSKAAPALWEKLQFGKRIDPLIAQALENKGEISNQMARELATAYASYVANGGTPAESAVKELLPPSFSGNLANLANFITNDMDGADRTAWLQQIHQSLAREEPVVIGGIREVLQHNDLGFPQMRAGDLAKQREAIIKDLTDKGYLAAPSEAAGPHQQPPGNFDLGGGKAERKVVGGKTYEKRADGWYEVK